MNATRRPLGRRLVASLFSVAVSLSGAARAAEIYVLDALMEREDASSASPTFIVTPGERALLSFGGERDVDVAMTLTPRAGADRDGDAFDLRVEVVDGVELSERTVPVSLAETETLELAGRTFKILVRVQEPLGQPSDGATPLVGDDSGEEAAEGG